VQDLGAHPNPFVESTDIAFSVPTAGRVSVRIYDVTGRLVRTVFDRTVMSGQYTHVWDGRDGNGHAVSPGVYLVRFEAGRLAATRKVVRIR
jgi:flagellar hook assembly protein FlgD